MSHLCSGKLCRDPGLRKWALVARELDFSEVRPSILDYKSLLVFINTIGWVEAYPT